MAETTQVQEKRPDRPERQSVGVTKASRDVKGSAWGGGGFVDYGGIGASSYQAERDYQDKASDYEKEVRRLETKEADAAWGSLTPDESGNVGYDATVEGIARNTKKIYADAKKQYDRGDISPEEFSQLKNNSFKQIDDLEKGGAFLTQLTQEYTDQSDQDQISSSTPAYIRDAFEELKSGGKNLSYTTDGEGRVFLEGTTATGAEPIKIPVDELAAGNGIKFNQKFDTAQTVDTVATGIHKIIQNGANLPYTELKGRIDNDLNKFIGGESARRAIAADEMGILPEQYDQLNEEDPDALKQQIKDFVSDKVEAQYFPNAKQEEDNRLLAAKISTERARASKLNRSGRGKRDENAAAIKEAKYVLNRSDFSAAPEWLATNLGAETLPETIKNEDGDEVPTGKTIINVDGKTVIINPKDPRKAKEIIAREIFGVRANEFPWLTGDEQGRYAESTKYNSDGVATGNTRSITRDGQNIQNPVQRNTPFKRLRAFVGI